ncbi:hypothetical protein NEISICOT_00405 [Neisseria sicca ATCC 29256]|uniref:Uncharacterized protein n=1 Tax=Neisseria sicca ATCC 29256 TaxID=547045 RepID=C6M1M0_NEISI|nr:hypothetical protein NEISICOT_00405 [Neisseria sicca ATCC 29256]
MLWKSQRQISILKTDVCRNRRAVKTPIKSTVCAQLIHILIPIYPVE